MDIFCLVYDNKEPMVKFFKSLLKTKRKAYWTTYPMYADNEMQKMEFMAEVWNEMETKIKIKNRYGRK